MIDFIKKLISNDESQSSTRFAFLLTVVLSNTTVWSLWLFLSLYKQEILDIPVGVYTALGVSNGIGFASKIGQKYIEHSENKTKFSEKFYE